MEAGRRLISSTRTSISNTRLFIKERFAYEFLTNKVKLIGARENIKKKKGCEACFFRTFGGELRITVARNVANNTHPVGVTDDKRFVMAFGARGNIESWLGFTIWAEGVCDRITLWVLFMVLVG